MAESGSDIPKSSGWFPETRWSVVLNAQSEEKKSDRASEAMAQLCNIYWRPVYRYIRSSRRTEDAEDLTQEFFAQLLRRETFTKVSAEKGKLRTFLLVSAKRFLMNDARKAQTQKRGGGVQPLSIDATCSDGVTPVELVDETSPEIQFDRQWVMTLLQKVMSELESIYHASGREEIFSIARDYLTADSEHTPYSDISEQLEITEGAARIAVFRLKRRYRELLQAEIAHTVATEGSIEEEIRYLMSVFSDQPRHQ